MDRRTGAPPFAVTDPDGSLPHEAFVELAGPPDIEVTVHPEGDTRTVVDGVDFPDVPHEHVPEFLRTVCSGGRPRRRPLLPAGHLPRGSPARRNDVLRSLWACPSPPG
ncbi:hypothetical protein [Streptomyces sp. I05A-00742]|uniref:hypothetical protein n=1 Tax=Streptomyces sp. I05A-00742 TaxID=2732853 RepID=UPI00289DA62A|nr:hypothetical protein [Streptomyces sp. I05A-00742]